VFGLPIRRRLGIALSILVEVAVSHHRTREQAVVRELLEWKRHQGSDLSAGFEISSKLWGYENAYRPYE
jgi:hypothetical protein